MKMLIKFESKSSRAKGVAFHPKRPWALVSLHSSTIQLWDYRMGNILDRFEDHEGPVRCVDFHPTQPLFVSGGDDYTIKVWSLNTRKCLFTLNGHLDYIRTVFFHKELPWIISASDDQTIRIWNWQNRQEIACLTGHNHYVMCAQFHPSEDLIVSASLDQTVRVWDISGLRKKHSAPTTRSFEDQLQRQQLPQQDVFGNVNAIVKYVLEGHDKGVNWASFHPTLPLIVSAGDDRVVKVWRMSETKAWEIDTCRGHTANVLGCVFHPKQDLILSVSDDKTLRVWDLNKRTPVKSFRREHDRFWLIASHPNINLFAACHDSGIMIFKLERERPAHAIFQNKLFYVNTEKQVQFYDYQRDEASLPMLSLKKIGKAWSAMRTLSYNQTDNSILVTHGDGDKSQYALINLPKHVTGAIEPTDIRQGEGNFACFISRNRFVSFVKATSTLNVRDLSNNVTKSIQLDSSFTDALYGGPGRVLLISAHSVVNYDVQQRKELSRISANSVKYVSWSNDGQYVALLSKHNITIATKDLEYITSLHETIRIKSAAWDETDVLVYSTLNHIKYSLLNGDSGIIKTLENTLYVTKVSGKKVYCLNRSGEVEVVSIDPTEYRFKKALVNKNFNEVLRIIKNSNLVGQNIISYLQRKDYPEVALQFVQDPETRFDLAIQSGDLQVAVVEAQKLNDSNVWEKLGEEALSQGNLEIVELVYQQLHKFDKLSFLYLIKTDSLKLSKMSEIAARRGDASSLIQNSIYENDVKSRIEVFKKGGLYPLAYTLAKSNGLEDVAAEILAEADVEASQIVLPELGTPAAVPVASTQPLANWPLKESSMSYFEKALFTGQVENLTIEDDVVSDKFEDTSALATPSAVEFEDEEDDLDADDGAWGLDDELDIGDDEVEESLHTDAVAAAGSSVTGAEGEIATWLRNATTAADYAAAGAFEQAASMLHKQLGVSNFEPLRERFNEIYNANKLYLPGVYDLPAMKTFVRVDNDEDNPNKFKPIIPGYSSLDEKLSTGFKFFRSNQLNDAIATFKEIIYTIALLTVSDEDGETRCKDILTLCREYILGLSIEVERRSIGDSDVKRNLELAAYFTKTQLQNPHRANALQVAMTQSFKYKNFASASYFASELLKIVPSGPRTEQAQKIKLKADTIASDAIEIDFDPYADFDICAGSFTPIYKGNPVVTEELVGAKYKPEFKGSTCFITEVTTVGAPASGLRIRG